MPMRWLRDKPDVLTPSKNGAYVSFAEVMTGALLLVHSVADTLIARSADTSRKRCRMRKTRTLAIGAACALALTTAACSNSKSSSGGDGASGPKTIKLGYVSSFSGPNGANFAQGLAAAQARFAAYKEDGGKCAATNFELV